jgi:hypothetical protein
VLCKAWPADKRLGPFRDASLRARRRTFSIYLAARPMRRCQSCRKDSAEMGSVPALSPHRRSSSDGRLGRLPDASGPGEASAACGAAVIETRHRPLLGIIANPLLSVRRSHPSQQTQHLQQQGFAWRRAIKQTHVPQQCVDDHSRAVTFRWESVRYFF